MLLDKAALVEQFLAAGDIEGAERADAELPDRIDPSEHAQTLRDLGIDPGLLLTSSANLEDQHPDDPASA